MAARKKTTAKRGRGGATPRRRTCGAVAAHMMLLETYRPFRDNLARLEGATVQRRQTRLRAADTPLVTVRTVVHVVHHTAAENISDAQIQSQLAVLNRDFSATNPDLAGVPAPWKGLATDARLAFELVDVTRTSTAVAGFGTDDAVKAAATGGIAPRDTKALLNIWVCPLAGGLLGYAQFPGGPAATDGVVITTSAFGSGGTASAPFDLGRTTTHEVGHYFNLRHIWGDTPDCSGSDAVADTPNAAGPNFGRPTWPSISCNNGPNGDMFMNYMDYVDDAAMFMFTAEQVLRMRAALDTLRAGLKG